MTKETNNQHLTVAEQLVKKALEQKEKQEQLDDELLKAVHKVGISDPLVLLNHEEQLRKWSKEQHRLNVNIVKERMAKAKQKRQQNIEKINQSQSEKDPFQD